MPLPESGKFLGTNGLRELISLIKTEDAKKIEGVKVNNVELTPDANKKVNVPLVSSSADGAMSSADKVKLDDIEEDAQENVIETVKVAGVALTPDANKAVDIVAVSSSTAGVMSSADKSKLDAIEAGAQVNVLEGVQVNGTDLAISSKKVNIDLTGYVEKTDIVSDFSTAIPSNGKVADAKGIQDYVNEKIQLHFIKLTTTNTDPIYYEVDPVTQAITIRVNSGVTPETNAIYLVPEPGSQTGTFIEYFYDSTTQKFEEFGRTSMDLSQYAKYTDFSTFSSAEVDNYWNAN